MMAETKQILREIKGLRNDVAFIKKSMPDKDMFLTLKEEKLLGQSYENEQRGKLISGKDLKKSLGL